MYIITNPLNISPRKELFYQSVDEGMDSQIRDLSSCTAEQEFKPRSLFYTPALSHPAQFLIPALILIISRPGIGHFSRVLCEEAHHHIFLQDCCDKVKRV